MSKSREQSFVRGDTYLNEGDTYWTSGIHSVNDTDVPSSDRRHGNKIVCYGRTEESAEELRDRVLSTLSVSAPAHDVGRIIEDLRDLKITSTILGPMGLGRRPRMVHEIHELANEAAQALSAIPIPAPTGEVERDEATDRIRGTLLREALLEHTENIPDRHEIDWGDAVDTFLMELAALTDHTTKGG